MPVQGQHIGSEPDIGAVEVGGGIRHQIIAGAAIVGAGEQIDINQPALRLGHHRLGIEHLGSTTGAVEGVA